MATINLKTNKKYVFIQKKTGRLFLQSAQVIPDWKNKVIRVQNYVQSSNRSRRKISVEKFNKLGLKFIGEL